MATDPPARLLGRYRWSCGNCSPILRTVQSLVSARQHRPAVVSFHIADMEGTHPMGRGQNQPATNSTAVLTAVRGETAPRAVASWESGLNYGLRMPSVPDIARAELASALGTLGVEAEYFLSLLAGFPGNTRPSHTRAVVFLSQLEAAARRLFHTADTLEIATQGYLSALESGYPEVRSQAMDVDPWWPTPPNFELEGESIELRMRRCGFAYRHVVEVYLAANVCAIASQMALVLHSLAILPPAGILPAGSLYQGLYELSSTFQGHVIPHHISDRDARTPGLLTGIWRLRRLDAEEETSLQSDRSWAQTQLRFVQEFLKSTNISSAQRQWAMIAATEWQQTIEVLGTLRSNQG